MIRRLLKIYKLRKQYYKTLEIYQSPDIVEKAQYLTGCAINNIAHEYNILKFIFMKRLKYTIEINPYSKSDSQ